MNFKINMYFTNVREPISVDKINYADITYLLIIFLHFFSSMSIIYIFMVPFYI